MAVTQRGQGGGLVASRRPWGPAVAAASETVPSVPTTWFSWPVGSPLLENFL